MSTQNFVVITSTQRTALVAMNSPGNAAIDPMAVTNTSPGIGLNINPDADDFEPGEAITLVGNFVAPKRIVDDPNHLTHTPDMVAMLLTLPWAMLETETIFAPFIE